MSSLFCFRVSVQGFSFTVFFQPFGIWFYIWHGDAVLFCPEIPVVSTPFTRQCLFTLIRSCWFIHVSVCMCVGGLFIVVILVYGLCMPYHSNYGTFWLDPLFFLYNFVGCFVFICCLFSLLILGSFCRWTLLRF